MSTSNKDKICNDGASKSIDDGVCEVNDMLQNMSTIEKDKDNEVLLDICANCGEEGNNNDMNTCNRCKMVKYCNAACKKKHRSKHKKRCDRRVAELHDEQLFKQPPQEEGCSICFLRMPTLPSGSKYHPCCGKTICSGCVYAPVYDNDGNVVTEKTCPFCRIPPSPSSEEIIKRVNRRVKAGDAEAINNLGFYYSLGFYGLSKDHVKALQIWHQAAELGFARAYFNIGTAYDCGRMGVEVDKKKGNHYYELAAMKGNAVARHNLGTIDVHAGNLERAIKHYMIAVRDGDKDSLATIQKLHSSGRATKEEYLKALRSYQEYLSEIKSDQREKAAAFDDKYKYY